MADRYSRLHSAGASGLILPCSELEPMQRTKDEAPDDQERREKKEKKHRKQKKEASAAAPPVAGEVVRSRARWAGRAGGPG